MMFSWEAYPRSLPKPPRSKLNEKARLVLILLILLYSAMSLSHLAIPHSSGYREPVDVEATFRDNDGRFITGVQVIVDDDLMYGVTGSNGMCLLEAVPAGLHEFRFVRGGVEVNREVFISRYASQDVEVVEDTAYPSFPSDIRSFEELNGLFYGVALVLGVFTLFSLLALRLLSQAPSLALGASVLTFVSLAISYGSERWLDMIASAALTIGIFGLITTFRLVCRQRVRVLTTRREM